MDERNDERRATSGRWPSALLNVLAVVVVGLFAGALTLGICVPLYTDEIDTKLMMARFFAEKGTIVTLLPQCTSAFIQDIPVALYGGAVLFTLVYGKLGLVGLRVSGLVFAFALYAALVKLAWDTTGAPAGAPSDRTARRDRRIRQAGLVAAALSTGVMPLVLVLSRSEQVMTLSLVTYAAFPSLMKSRGTTPLRQGALIAAFVVLTSLFLYAHPKYLFFVPFLLVTAYFSVPERRRRVWFGGLVLAMLVGFVQRQAWSRATTSCDESPFVKRVLSDITLNPNELSAHPLGFLSTGTRNVLELPSRIATGLAFKADYGGWLPRPAGGAPLSSGVEHVNSLLLIATVAAMVMALARVAVVFRTKEGASRPSSLMAATLVVAVVGNGFFYNQFAFYNCELTVPCMVLAVILAGAAPRPSTRRHAGLSLAGRALALALAGASLITLLVHLTPALLRSARTVGTVSAESPYSVPIFGYAAEREKIRALSSECGIHGDGATRLVSDDATYFAFEDQHQPVNLLYISDAVLWGTDLKGEAIRPFLKRLRSPGIIARCTYFPTALRAEAKTHHGYCCVPATAFGTTPEGADAP